MDQKTAKHLTFNYLKMQQSLEYQKPLIIIRDVKTLDLSLPK